MAECGFVDVGCKASEALNGVTEGLTSDIKDAVEMFVRGAFTGWIHMPTPFIGANSGPVGFLRDNLMILAGLLMAMAVIGFAMRLMFKPDRDTIGGGAAFLLRNLVVLGGSVTIGGMLVNVADQYSVWILDRATQGQGLATTILNTFQMTGPLGFFAALIFGVVAIFASIIQGLLLAARNVMLPLLIGVAPVAVALSNSEIGKSWWTKYLTWFLAFLLYKPTAATIYAVGFYMLGEGDIFGSQNLGEAVIAGMNFIYGSMLLFMAIAAFGALMAVVTPVTGKLAGGMAGAAMIGASATALAASGAIGRPSGGVDTPPAPASVSPANAAAGATGAAGSPGSPSPGMPGTPGGPGAPGAPGSPSPAGAAGAAGAATVHPVLTGVQVVSDTAGKAQQGLSRGLNNENSEEA